jgi:hypothetical protein
MLRVASADDPTRTTWIPLAAAYVGRYPDRAAYARHRMYEQGWRSATCSPVPMLGADANWVRNVRAAGGSAVRRRGRCQAIRLVEFARIA